MFPTRVPVPLSQLTPDRLIGVNQVRAFDPHRPGFDAWVPVGPTPHPDDTIRVLEVAIDRDRLEEQLAQLVALVRGRAVAAEWGSRQ
jgi:hypothetical protein